MHEPWGRLEIAMQHKRVEVSAVGPYNRAELIVHANPGKELGVCKRLEHWAAQLSGKIDIAGDAITEAEPQSIVAKHLD
jgi:hypothetical protein